MRQILAIGCAALALVVARAQLASAADLYVTTTVDTFDGFCDTHCSLRDAVHAANADPLTEDTIHLQAATYELAIEGFDEDASWSGDLDLRSSMSILGKGPGITTIDANFVDRVLDINVPGVDVTIRGVTITGGRLASQYALAGAGVRIRSPGGTVAFETCILESNLSFSLVTTAGGALFVEGADVDFRNTIIRSNSATRGGAIYTWDADANVTLERCAVYDNTTFGGLGVIENSHGTMVIYTSTVSNNLTASGHAGVRNYQGTLLIINSTLSDNTNAEIIAVEGGGGLVTLTGTLIVGTCFVEHPTAIHSDWYNLESPGDTCELDLFQDEYNVADPMIGGLAFNGGPTPTRLPDPLSPVVDPSFASTATCPGPDQRWISRPWDGAADPDTIPECDVGAVEHVPGALFFDGFECGFTTTWSTTSG